MQNFFLLGGIFDETGFDGLDQSVEDLFSYGSESRTKERAKSAAMVWLKKNKPTSKMEPYGCNLKDNEGLKEWSIYEVIYIWNGSNNLMRLIYIFLIVIKS